MVAPGGREAARRFVHFHTFLFHSKKYPFISVCPKKTQNVRKHAKPQKPSPGPRGNFLRKTRKITKFPDPTDTPWHRKVENDAQSKTLPLAPKSGGIDAYTLGRFARNL